MTKWPARLIALVALVVQAAGLPAIAAPVTLPDAITFGVRVEQGDLTTVSEWLDAGLDPDYVADRIGTGVMIAAWDGNIPMMELFVKHGANVNRANDVDEQALMLAVWKGRREAAAWLLDHGAQINREGNEWSALHYAAFAGHDEIAKFLIDKGANVNAKSDNGSTVLMMAAHEGHEKIAGMLVQAGAIRSTKNDWGEDALTWAMRYSHLAIAKMIATDDDFAQAATQPKESWGAAVSPIPAPAEVETILQQQRLAHVNGTSMVLSDADYRKILERVAAMKPASVPARRARGMSITAKKGDPARERAELQFGK